MCQFRCMFFHLWYPSRTLQLCGSRSSEKVWKTNWFVSLVNRKSTRIFLIIGHHEVKRNQINSIKNSVCMIQHSVDKNVTTTIQGYANLDSQLNLLSEYLSFFLRCLKSLMIFLKTCHL